jgi:hypothetical protein
LPGPFTARLPVPEGHWGGYETGAGTAAGRAAVGIAVAVARSSREVSYLKVYAYRIRRKLGAEDGRFRQSDPSAGYRLAWQPDES